MRERGGGEGESMSGRRESLGGGWDVSACSKGSVVRVVRGYIR